MNRVHLFFLGILLMTGLACSSHQPSTPPTTEPVPSAPSKPPSEDSVATTPPATDTSDIKEENIPTTTPASLDSTASTVASSQPVQVIVDGKELPLGEAPVVLTATSIIQVKIDKAPQQYSYVHEAVGTWCMEKFDYTTFPVGYYKPGPFLMPNHKRLMDQNKVITLAAGDLIAKGKDFEWAIIIRDKNMDADSPTGADGKKEFPETMKVFKMMTAEAYQEQSAWTSSMLMASMPKSRWNKKKEEGEKKPVRMPGQPRKDGSVTWRIFMIDAALTTRNLLLEMHIPTK